MSIEKIGLSKLLKLFGADDALRKSLIREDLRREKAELDGRDEGGGDFYVPFWADAKAYVASGRDLHAATDARIADLKQRESLYPQLRDGFLAWVELSRRDTNVKLVPSEQTVHARSEFPDLHLILKVENVMAMDAESGRPRLIYPYFCKQHALSDKWGRVGLWLMAKAFRAFELDELEIVDVMRGTSVSGRRTALLGDEERLFTERYRLVHDEWERLKGDYGLD
jgi:hypothetical protein